MVNNVSKVVFKCCQTTVGSVQLEKVSFPRKWNNQFGRAKWVQVDPGGGNEDAGGCSIWAFEHWQLRRTRCPVGSESSNPWTIFPICRCDTLCASASCGRSLPGSGPGGFQVWVVARRHWSASTSGHAFNTGEGRRWRGARRQLRSGVRGGRRPFLGWAANQESWRVVGLTKKRRATSGMRRVWAVEEWIQEGRGAARFGEAEESRGCRAGRWSRGRAGSRSVQRSGQFQGPVKSWLPVHIGERSDCLCLCVYWLILKQKSCICGPTIIKTKTGTDFTIIFETKIIFLGAWGTHTHNLPLSSQYIWHCDDLIIFIPI